MTRETMQNMPNSLVGTPAASLWEMLTAMRPSDGPAEAAFVKQWVRPLGTWEDAAGNHILRVGDSPVMWSCHTDTAHRYEGFQRIRRQGDLLRLHRRERRASCLGADCTTGVWLMREMVHAGVPGLYVFHTGEEMGGFGSAYIAKHFRILLKDIEFAIALDRKDKQSVITHQLGARCCSEEFAWSLADQLPGLYWPDDSGTFTDTASYMEIVPECSNISVGYMFQHTRSETQSVSHALQLREALLDIDTSRFTCRRDPSTIEYGGEYVNYVYKDIPPASTSSPSWLDDAFWREEKEEEEYMSMDGPYTEPWDYNEDEGYYDPKNP